jgi:hypothetical protein
MAPLDMFPLRPLEEHPDFLRRHFHNELASHWSREETRLLCPPVELMEEVVRKLRISKEPALLLMTRLAEAIMVPASHGHEHHDASPAASPGRSLDRDTTTECILASPADRSEPASRRPPVPADPALTMLPSDGRDTRRRRHPSHLIWTNAMDSTEHVMIRNTAATVVLLTFWDYANRRSCLSLRG